MSLAVLVPVLGRPARTVEFARQLRETSLALLVLLPNKSDVQQVEAAYEASGDVIGVAVMVVPWKAGAGDYAKKINIAFKATEATWVLQAADDLFFHPNWEREALSVAEWSGKRVIGTNDLCNPATKLRHSTHTLVRRDYVEELGGGWDGPGILLHEGYDHQWIDNELVTAAKMRNEWAHASNSHVEHLHPLCGHPRDKTYEKSMAKGREDGALFRERLKLAQQGKLP